MNKKALIILTGLRKNGNYDALAYAMGKVV